MLYWSIGREILSRQQVRGWGAKVIDSLARDLRGSFPDMRGLSPRNLKYMRAFAEAWPDEKFVQQAAAQMPWFRQRLDSSPADAAMAHSEEWAGDGVDSRNSFAGLLRITAASWFPLSASPQGDATFAAARLA